MTIRGYARVSTVNQHLDTQIDKLKQAGVDEVHIITDKASGKDLDRPGLDRLLVKVDPGDIIYCTKLDRLGRSTLDMLQILEELTKKGVAVRFLDDNVSTEGHVGVMTIQILAAVAQSERYRILERTAEGRARAMAEGIKFGRKPHKGLEKAKELIAIGASKEVVMRETDISKSTYYRLRDEMKKAQ